jgi:acetoin utilization protein AcuB
MLIRHFMTRRVITLPAEISCSRAWRVFRAEKLRRAPIERGSRVVGMITDRDLARILPWSIGELERGAAETKEEIPLERLCGKRLISISPGEHLEVAARKMLENRIGGLPVIDEERLVGIITESDLFKIFLRLKQGTRAVRLSLHESRELAGIVDPARLALAAGVEIREHISHPSPSGGTLVDLRVVGKGINGFLDRLLSAGYLLIDRQDPGSG